MIEVVLGRGDEKGSAEKGSAEKGSAEKRREGKGRRAYRLE